MVLKLSSDTTANKDGFENDVKMYGTQTPKWESKGLSAFENDVKMYGTQTNNFHPY